MVHNRQSNMFQSRVPKVSVVVPNYNHAKFLPERLQSILTQSFQEYELLILDDRSSDASIEVIRPYLTDPRARLELNEENSGSPYRQWRKGIALTCGEYIWIAESDDFADPALLETLVKALDSDPTVGIATCLSREIDGDGRIVRRYFDEWIAGKGLFSSYGDFPFDQPLQMNGRTYCARYMNPFNTLPNASAMLFRRTALEAIGGPVDSMKICGDWFTYCKILLHWNIVIWPESLNYFRTHTTNVRQRTKVTDFIREAREVRAFLQRHINERPSAAARRLACTIEALMIIEPEHAQHGGKVPLKCFFSVIGRAFPFGMALTARVIQMLVRETMASCWKQLRSGKV